MASIKNIIDNMRKECIIQNKKIDETKKISFLTCYHEGYKDGIVKCYEIIKKECIKC